MFAVAASFRSAASHQHGQRVCVETHEFNLAALTLSCPIPTCLVPLSGALLAIGIVNACVQNENDPAFALISDYVSNPDPAIRVGAILGLGLAYAGTNREEVEVGTRSQEVLRVASSAEQGRLSAGPGLRPLAPFCCHSW